jgi:hypothetical protein
MIGLACLMISGCGPVRVPPYHPHAAGGIAPTRPDRDAGRFGVAAGSDLGAYDTIVVGKVGVQEQAGWDAVDRAMAERLAAFFRSEVIRRLSNGGLFVRTVGAAGTQPAAGTPRALRLEGDVTDLEVAYPTPRGWVGPGGIQIETRFSDVESGQVLLVTADRRFAGQLRTATRDVDGNEQLLRRSLGDMARGLVDFLTHRGEASRPHG